MAEAIETAKLRGRCRRNRHLRKSAKNQKNGRKRRIRSCAHFRPPDDPAVAREIPLANYQPTVTVAIVGAAVCSDELKPPTSSYAKPYDSALMLWSCQNFE